MGKDMMPSFKFSSNWKDGQLVYVAYLEDSSGEKVKISSNDYDELCEKYEATKKRIEKEAFSRKCPSVREYCEKWLLMQSANVRTTSMLDYTSKVRRHIIEPLGNMKMSEVTTDDIKLALVPVSELSASVFKSVNILYKCIFDSAEEAKIITYNPTRFLSKKGGGRAPKEKEALTDDQIRRLLDAVAGLPVYVFIMLGLYAGLRREEILALKWECVVLDSETPYIMVRRAWHPEHNRPIIVTELKTKAASRDIAIPENLVECLREAKSVSRSEYVIASPDGEPLSGTQYKRLWHSVVVRIAKPRLGRKKVGDKYVKYMLYPELGAYARNNGKVRYVLDFDVTPHQLRHTYITNLIAAGVDPKTVQYLAGHESSKITMDIYAKVKYNRPAEVAKLLKGAFSLWDGAGGSDDNGRG